MEKYDAYVLDQPVKMILEDGTRIPGTVVGIHFTEEKVRHDVQVQFAGGVLSTLHNIDSALVHLDDAIA
ncbi:hypothetical protein [Magnetococcus sp. PR-3]|uniref:hypothetical protein n=1 Tax=Magnetococcus sp. PR-3 TaxID=3120355 RepID=UPI002FCE5E24